MILNESFALRHLDLQLFAVGKVKEDEEEKKASGYGSGSGYSNRETAYTWKDGTTTYSNATRYEDAAKEAGKEGVGLARATTYSTKKGTADFTDDIYSNDTRSEALYLGPYDYDLYEYVNGNIPAFNELYGGGGNNYNRPGGGYMPSFNFDADKPADYNSEYKARQDALLDLLLNREDFVYDHESDPLWGNYKSQYLREGQRAMEDTMAAVASGAYGMNSHAIAAGQQARNYYNAQLTDKIPELRDIAYSMYLDDIERDMANYGLLVDADNTAYDRHRDTVNDWYSDRDFAYGVYRDDMNDYFVNRDYEYNTNRDREEDEQRDYETAYEQAMEFLSAGVMPSAELLARAGISSSEAQSYVAGKRKTGSSKSGSGDAVKDDDIIPYDATIQNGSNGYITIPGHGRFSYSEIANYVSDGTVEEVYDPITNSVKYVWIEGAK